MPTRRFWLYCIGVTVAASAIATALTALAPLQGHGALSAFPGTPALIQSYAQDRHTTPEALYKLAAFTRFVESGKQDDAAYTIKGGGAYQFNPGSAEQAAKWGIGILARRGWKADPWLTKMAAGALPLDELSSDQQDLLFYLYHMGKPGSRMETAVNLKSASASSWYLDNQWAGGQGPARERVLHNWNSKLPLFLNPTAVEATKSAASSVVKVEDLLRAKEYSDRRDMAMKNRLLSRLINSAPEEFARTDEILPGGYVGISHVPTSFYFHVDRRILPKSLGKQSPDTLQDTAGSRSPAKDNYDTNRPVVQLPTVVVDNHSLPGGKQEISGEEYESLVARMAAMNKEARFSRPATAKALKRDKGGRWSIWYGDDRLDAEASTNPWVWVVVYDTPGNLHGATRIYAQLNAGVHEQNFATDWAHFMSHDREKNLASRAEKFMSTWEARTKVQTQGRDNIKFVKSAEAGKRFHVPENPDFLEEKGNLRLYVGSNDWEASSCWAWIVHPEERHLQYRVYWVKFDYATREHNGEPTDEPTEEADSKAERDKRKALARKWLVASSKVITDRDYSNKASLEQQVLDAFPDKDALASCGSQKTEWKVQPESKEVKSAATLNPAGTGPEAIAQALAGLDLDSLEATAKADVASGKVTRRDRAVAILRASQGMRRNGITPKDLMISKVPVIPAQFRPFVMIGDQFVPGDANELYRDLIQTRDAYQGAKRELGDAGTAANRLHVYDAVRGLYGYGEPVNPKTKERGIQGFLQQLTGTSPKWSFFNRRLLSKTQDNVGRAVIGVDPDLSIDQIGLPEEMAWTIYAPYVQRRLVQSGAPAARAVTMIRDRDPAARRHLEAEVKERPVIYSRAPAWHKFSALAAYPRLIQGDTIKINSLVGTGLGADFDGDAINVHVPSFPSAVDEAKTKLLGSKMLWSPRDPDRIVNLPKHELVLGLYNAGQTPAKNSHLFSTKQEAMAAIKSGKVNPEDEIEIPDAKTIGKETT